MNDVLICGAGIAGPTLAYWLERRGFRVTVVERAAELRRGGYIIDFWGAGFEVAERMGLAPELSARGYRVQEVRLVDRAGRRAGGFGTDGFERLAGGRYTSLPRGELASAIYERIRGSVETIFGDTVTALEPSNDGVRVQFEHTAARKFDLVIGADGLHSTVRSLTFAEASSFEKYLGYKVAAFECVGYRPRDESAYVLFTQVGQQVGRFAMRGDRTMFLFVFADESAQIPETAAEQKRVVRERFAGAGWECKAILDALDASDNWYFDRVSQIRMPSWSRGRVCLVGDAAFCVSLLAGQGSALAMVAAYVLAGELGRSRTEPLRAFTEYEARLRPLLTAKQEGAKRFASTFAPRSALGLFVRNQASRLLSLPFIAELAFARDLRDRIELPDY